MKKKDEAREHLDALVRAVEFYFDRAAQGHNDGEGKLSKAQDKAAKYLNRTDDKELAAIAKHFNAA